MPIYEYRCTKCKKQHEVIQKMSDPPLKTCPSCKGKLEKELSLSGFQLKGGGWYKDGYTTAKPDKKSSEAGAASSAPTTPPPAQSSPSAPAAPAADAPKKSPKKGKSDQ